MKKIGLIGGTTWHSTIDYYRLLNETVADKMGKSHCADLIIRSVDFEEYKNLAEQGKWDIIGSKLTQIATELESVGAEAIALCANTTHKVAPQISKNIKIPLIHIGEAMAEQLSIKACKKAGLLGTIYTMKSEFIPEKLKEKGIDCVIPEEEEMVVLNNFIFDELGKGIFLDNTKMKILEVIENLRKKGADSIILGCTEFPLIIKEPDTDLPLINSTLVHANAIVDFALKSIN